MKKGILFFYMLSICYCVFSQKQSQLPTLNTFKKSVFRTVDKKVGSGFLVIYKEFIYIVTAAHVQEEFSPNTEIWFHAKNGSARKYLLSDVCENFYNWTIHPKADIAINRLNPNSKFFCDTILDVHYIDILAANFKLENVIKSLEEDGISFNQVKLYSLGFPAYPIDYNKKCTPNIVVCQPTSEIIDWINEKKDTVKGFTINHTIAGGYSGGPIFLCDNKGEPIILIGLNTAHFLQSYELKNNKNEAVGYSSDAREGLVTYSDYIMETFKKVQKYNGLYRIYHSSCKEWSTLSYTNGLLMEVYTNFDSKGNHQDKGTLKNGNGTRKIYNENDKLVEIEEYKNGELVKSYPPPIE
jgi:hypothetical protein